MASGGDVSAVYTSVIDDVVANVRKEFLSHGAGDGVLHQLRALWEAKMVHSGALPGTRAPSPGAGAPAAEVTPPLEDPSAPPPSYDEGYHYATPTADMLFPPTPIRAVKEEEGAEPRLGRPSPYYAPPSPVPWLNLSSPLGADVDVAYQESLEDPDTAPRTRDFLMVCPGKRKRGDEFPGQRSSGSASALPQQDGSADQTVEFVLPESSEGNAQELWNSVMGKQGSTSCVKETTRSAPVIPQLDRVQGDGYYDYQQHFFPAGGVSTEYYDALGESSEYPSRTPAVATPSTDAGGDDDDDDEPPLNEHDDDDDDEDELKDSEPNAQHLVLAQFVKVTRTKNRWRCSLKDGIMHLNGTDILFNKASAEFDF